MKRTTKDICVFVGMVALAITVSSEAFAQQIDFGKAEDAGNQMVAWARGGLATIAFSLAFIVTGFLAAFNKISWGWVGGVVLGAFFVFAGPALVENLRQMFS